MVGLLRGLASERMTTHRVHEASPLLALRASATRPRPASEDPAISGQTAHMGEQPGDQREETAETRS